MPPTPADRLSHIVPTAPLSHFARCLLSAAALSLAASTAGKAQTSAERFPERPLKLVVPFPPGGPADIIARVVGQGLSDRLGQPVLIDNRGGAGGVTGTDAVAKASPDGYSIALSSAGALAISASLQEKMPYDARTDLQPITLSPKCPNFWSCLQRSLCSRFPS